ncbi:MAG: hypothetical protein E7I93_04875 [Clostridium perfringens]|nr:hypothetical protein [Clostridium perfringens]
MNEKLANKEISQCNYEKESLNNREIKNSVRSLLYNIVKGMISDFGLGLIFVVFLKQWVYILIIVLFQRRALNLWIFLKI